MKKFTNFNDLYIDSTQDICKHGKPSSPRNMKCWEKLNYCLQLTDTSQSLCTIKNRKLNYAFNIIEKLEYLYGEQDPDRICFYNKNFRNFINENTGKFDGAYAPRIKRQIMYIYDLLKRDPDTRQAIININNESDKHESKDVPCTISFQFILREGKLHMTTYMRSNDILWGTPYDINAFCFIQSALALWLDVETGTYTHFVGSMHAYDDFIDTLEKLDGSEVVANEDKKWDIKDIHESYNELETFFQLEKGLRENNNYISPDGFLRSKTLISFYNILHAYCIKKNNKKTFREDQ